MLLSTALGLFLAFWSLLYLLDYYLKTRSFNLYLHFVERTGLVVTPFQVRWYTSRFQRTVHSWGFLRRGWIVNTLKWWFGVGVFFALAAMIVMVWMLTDSLWAELRLRFIASPPQAGPAPENGVGPDQGETSPHSRLIPIVPGINVPWEHIPILLLVLVLAGVFHELGHAMAAVVENVMVNGFGIFLLGIYPGAFTEIENESLSAISPFRKLKIYCGGIWHNIVLALVGLLCLNSMGTWLSPAYMVDKGVLVNSVNPNSGISGPAGLSEGHVVYGVNYCKIYNEDSWFSCLKRLTKTHYGYCVPRKEILANRSQRVLNVHGELQCCGLNATQSHLCFYYKTHNDSRIENIFQYSCLPARYVTDHYVCNNSLPCGSGGRTLCVYPALFNSTKLLRFFIANHSKPVLFVGYPSEIASLVSVSSFIPKSGWVPVWFPSLVSLTCKYLITLSLALAFLNAVPCFTLDGQFIAATLLQTQLIRHRKWARRKPGLIYSLVMYSGTFLLLSNAGLALWNLLRPYFMRS